MCTTMCVRSHEVTCSNGLLTVYIESFMNVPHLCELPAVGSQCHALVLSGYAHVEVILGIIVPHQQLLLHDDLLFSLEVESATAL